MNATNVNITRKITLKNCGATQKALKEAVSKLKDGEMTAALRVFGIATGYKPGQTDKGEYLLLIGEFNALNLLDGSRYSAGKAILPNFIAENFQPVLDKNGSAEFALEILVQRSDTSVTGYQFVARPLIESRASDRMAELAAQAMKGLPALTGPSEETGADESEEGEEVEESVQMRRSAHRKGGKRR
jgi:hypothetical protein